MPAAKSAAMGKVNPMQAKVEQRIADMYATLHITSAQDPQWNAFAQVMLDNAQAMDTELHKNAAAGKLNAQQQLHAYAEVTQLHADNVQKLAAAFDTLYPSLTPAQQTAADQMFSSAAMERHQKHGT